MASVVLGISGSVAAYRAADLARDLMRADCTVRACLTQAAAKFVSPDLFQALTGQPCLSGDVFEEPEAGRMAHIDWARGADALLIAPATGDILNKLAAGIADDMLTTIALAYTGPLVIAPAMNPSMYANENVQEAVAKLKARVSVFIEPEDGDVACGEYGQGKLAANARIVEATLGVIGWQKQLASKRVLITSGPTQEPIDDVRYISNHSSGKMGAAIARAAQMMGAEVTVVSGPSQAPMPLGAKVVQVKTAQEMLDAALALAPDADLIIGVAAVADFRVVNPAQGKIRRGDGNLNLELTPNPDIIAALSKAAKPIAKVIGFAAEPTSDLEIARQKLRRKGLFAIAHNDVSSPGIGFGADANALTLIRAEGEPENSGTLSKLQCAKWLLDRLA